MNTQEVSRFVKFIMSQPRDRVIEMIQASYGYEGCFTCGCVMLQYAQELYPEAEKIACSRINVNINKGDVETEIEFGISIGKLFSEIPCFWNMSTNYGKLQDALLPEYRQLAEL